MGEFLVMALPKAIRALTFIGTLAMFLIAGGIYMHNVEQIHNFLHFMPSILGELLVGGIIGFIAVSIHIIITKIKNSFIRS